MKLTDAKVCVWWAADTVHRVLILSTREWLLLGQRYHTLSNNLTGSHDRESTSIVSRSISLSVSLKTENITYHTAYTHRYPELSDIILHCLGVWQYRC
jgi:hypothetical protein